MGKMKSYIQDWLENTGYDLGYDINNIPRIEHFGLITRLRIKAHEFFGYRTEEEYMIYEDEQYRNAINKFEGE
tara:strand:- start:379 stop:597 length:219 start_codon:yes stop_codon:yes gene_type:complete